MEIWVGLGGKEGRTNIPYTTKGAGRFAQTKGLVKGLASVALRLE